MAASLEGFFDRNTIEALKRAEGCTNSRISGYPINNTSHPLTGTMWYDGITGTIHAFGNGKPYHLKNNRRIVPTMVLFDETDHQPLPQHSLFFGEEMTPALETALASIRAYREQNQ